MSLPVIRALRSLFLPLLIISCALSGCSEDNITVELIGQVDRSLPAGMTVCLDISGNGTCDADEPSARTNADGTYSVVIPAKSSGGISRGGRADPEDGASRDSPVSSGRKA